MSVMNADHKLTETLSILGAEPARDVSDDFMHSVWEKAGQLQNRRDQRHRTALFAALFVVGLGTGIGTVQVPAQASEAVYILGSDVSLSPASLLHVSR